MQESPKEIRPLANKLKRSYRSTIRMSKDYQLIGMAGEACFFELLGPFMERWNTNFRGVSDNGVDFVDRNGFTYDVKSARHPKDLYVLVKKFGRAEAFVLAGADPDPERFTGKWAVRFADCSAFLKGWMTAEEVKAYPQVDSEFGPRYTVPGGKLRSIDELHRILGGESE